MNLPSDAVESSSISCPFVSEKDGQVNWFAPKHDHKMWSDDSLVFVRLYPQSVGTWLTEGRRSTTEGFFVDLEFHWQAYQLEKAVKGLGGQIVRASLSSSAFTEALMRKGDIERLPLDKLGAQIAIRLPDFGDGKSSSPPIMLDAYVSYIGNEAGEEEEDLRYPKGINKGDIYIQPFWAEVKNLTQRQSPPEVDSSIKMPDRDQTTGITKRVLGLFGLTY